MPGFNTSGAPNTRDYTLGRGRLYFGKHTSTGAVDADGLRDLGNVPEMTTTIAVEDLTHQSSRSGLKITDARCTISQEIGLSFQLDEQNLTNMADWMSATVETFNNPHDTTFAAADSIVSASIKLGRWYELKDDNGVRVYDLGATGLVYTLVEDPGGTPAALAANDYEIDLQMGLVRFLGTGTSTLPEASEIGFGITTGASTAQDLDQVNALKVSQVEGTLIFIQENACDSDNKTEYRFHKVTLSADGDLTGISDEIATMGFTGVAGVNNSVTDASKVLTVRSYDQSA
jgi:hypothetical protein